MNEHTDEYCSHLRSDAWKRTRWAKLWQAGYRCESCGKHHGECPLDVHHETYERLGREKLTDLMVLCRDCHEEKDMERRARSRKRAAVETFMAKKYGEDWGGWFDWHDAHEEFDSWLERRSEEP